MGGLFAFLTLLTATIPLKGAVMGNGRVAGTIKVAQVAHPAGGVVSRVLIKDGDRVAKGQLLVELDDTVVGAEALSSTDVMTQLQARRARLEAERLGTSTIAFPASMSAGDAREAIADERRLFAIRQAELLQARKQISAQSRQIDDEVAGLEAQMAALRTQRELIEGERQSVQELWKKRLVTISRVSQIERAAVELDGNLAALQARISGARGRQAELAERSLGLVQTRRAEAGRDLTDLNVTLAQQGSRIVAAADQNTRSQIRAPIAGTIDNLELKGTGDVIRPAQPFLEIVPSGTALIVEARISPSDIDQVRVGQRSSVIFTAYNRASTSRVDGRVIFVSGVEAVASGQQSPAFLVRVAFDRHKLPDEGLALRIGMPAEVFVQTSSRTILSFIFKPLSDQLRRAFRSD